MTCYDSEYATIKYFPEQRFVFTRYHGFVPSAELRKILDKTLELFTEKDIELSLSDSRKMKAIRPADQEYINNEWLPEIIKKAKIKKSASLQSSDVFAKMAVENILRKADGLIKFDTHYFDTLEDACKWLGIDRKLIEE